MRSDADIIAEIKEGDRDQYRELVNRYERLVYGIAWSRLGNADLCEEAAQEAFIKAFRYLLALRDPSKFPGWLARIARNVSVTVGRRNRRELTNRKRWELEQPASRPEAPQAGDAGESVSETLHDALAALTVDQRECLVLFYMEGKSVRDVAALAQISEDAAKMRLHRARRALRTQLETRLADGLANLGPRRNLGAIVMPLLPAAPVGMAGAGGLSVLGKVLASLGPAVVLVLWIPASTVAVLGGFAWLEGKNLAPAQGSDVRRKVLRANTVGIVLVVVCVLALSMGIPRFFQVDPRTIYWFLIPFCLWGAYQYARALRVNSSPFTYGMLASMATFLVISILMGPFQGPFWIFPAGLLPLNIVLYRTNKSRPNRHDYNLFLRHQLGLLKGISSPAAPPQEHLTSAQLKAFARFLGERFLVVDYTWRAGGIVLYLPPVTSGLAQLGGLTVRGGSAVYVADDGRCTATIGKRDWRMLTQFCGNSPDMDGQEREVSGIVEQTLALFTEGRVEEAAAILQTQTDDEVLHMPTGNSLEHRLRGMMAIVAAVIMLVGFAMFYLLTDLSRHSWDTPERRLAPIQVTSPRISGEATTPDN